MKKTILIFIFILCITACSKDGNTFNYKTLNGKVKVKGYITKLQFTEEYCESDCKMYDYYMFKITETESEDFKKYLNDLDGNSFGGIDEIGLGCLNNNKINYINYNDKNGLVDVELNEKDSKVIIDSNIDNQITLELEKDKSTEGRGAPKCYSHITRIKVVK